MSLVATAGLVNTGSKAVTGKGILGNFKDLNPFSSKGKGYGMTKANTLSHAIDKLERANDFTAIDAAEKVRAQIAAGVTDISRLFRVIENDLGYSPGSVERSGSKGPYIKNMLIEEIQKGGRESVQRQKNKMSGPILAGAGLPISGGVNTYLLIAAAAGLIFWGIQSGKK